MIKVIKASVEKNISEKQTVLQQNINDHSGLWYKIGEKLAELHLHLDGDSANTSNVPHYDASFFRDTANCFAVFGESACTVINAGILKICGYVFPQNGVTADSGLILGGVGYSDLETLASIQDLRASRAFTAAGYGPRMLDIASVLEWSQNSTAFESLIIAYSQKRNLEITYFSLLNYLFLARFLRIANAVKDGEPGQIWGLVRDFADNWCVPVLNNQAFSFEPLNPLEFQNLKLIVF